MTPGPAPRAGTAEGGRNMAEAKEEGPGPCARFEDKSDAVFDITEKCSEILDAEMSEDTVHNLPTALDSVSYEIQNRAGSENSLLDDDDDDDYFLNSGDLASIPVVGSDNEDDQNFTPKDTLPSEDHLEEGKRITEHELDSEKRYSDRKCNPEGSHFTF